MKIILSLIAFACMTPSAFAAPTTGSATITFREVGGRSQLIETDVRREGTKLLGQSTNGGMVYLETANNFYQGLAASHQLTSLKCSAVACSGIISGRSADFSIVTRQDRGRTVYEGRGSLNFHPYSVVRTADSVQVSAGGLFNLVKVAPGVYKGSASFFHRMHRFDLTVKGAGDLSELAEDPALAAIFLAGPVANN